MFLYTSFEILLYVVYIFNTSANAKSQYIFLRTYELSDLFFHSYFSGLFIFSPAKVSFITGTNICRTTDILMINWNYTVHGTYLLLPFIFNLIKWPVEGSTIILLDKYPLEISSDISLLDGLIISPEPLFVNTFLWYISNKFIIDLKLYEFSDNFAHLLWLLC